MDDVRLLLREYRDEFEDDTCFNTFEDELAGLPGAYARPRGLIVLGFEKRKPAACACLRPLSARDCEMKRLYVRPESRGSGIGQALVRRLLREARLLEYSTLKLDTLSSMDAAIRLYERMGFRRIPPYAGQPKVGVICFERAI
jgi:ribosomal protein S18 acetylase RimI-like enzyme